MEMDENIYQMGYILKLFRRNEPRLNARGAYKESYDLKKDRQYIDK